MRFGEANTNASVVLPDSQLIAECLRVRAVATSGNPASSANHAYRNLLTK